MVEKYHFLMIDSIVLMKMSYFKYKKMTMVMYINNDYDVVNHLIPTFYNRWHIFLSGVSPFFVSLKDSDFL